MGHSSILGNGQRCPTVASVEAVIAINPLTPVDTFMCHITLYPRTPNDTFMCHNGAREI